MKNSKRLARHRTTFQHPALFYTHAMIRPRLLPALCAVALLGFTGCAGDDKNASGDNAAPAAAQPEPTVASPKPAADTLIKKLTDFDARIRTADAAFARVVGVTATDPEERILAFNKAVSDIGGDTAASLAADLKKAGADIVAAWDSNSAAVSDSALRRIADGNRDNAAAAFSELDAAIKKTDAALAFHAAYVSQVRAVLGSRPGADQLVAARPAAKELTRRGNLAVGWLEYTAKVARKAGLVPVPVAQPKVEEVKPTEAAPAEVKPAESKPAETKPAEPAANSEKPKTSEIIIEVKRAEEPAPAPAPAAPAAPAPEAPKPVEAPKAPAPKPATPDPVPEPVEA